MYSKRWEKDEKKTTNGTLENIHLTQKEVVMEEPRNRKDIKHIENGIHKFYLIDNYSKWIKFFNQNTETGRVDKNF